MSTALKRPRALALRRPAFVVIAALVLLKLLLFVLAAQPAGGAFALCQFDCTWYLHTADAGYDPYPLLDTTGADPANWVFFPLYPLAIRLLMTLTGLSAFWSATLVAALCFAGFAAVSIPYRRLTRGSTGAWSWVVLLLVYPWGLYFVFAYSESAYLLTTILVLLAYQMRAPLAAGLATALLTATRPTGVLAIPFLAVAALWRERALFRPTHVPARWPRLLALALPIAVAPLGIALYSAYLYRLTGDALAFQHAQAVWGRTFANPLKTFYWDIAAGDWSVLLRPEGPESRSYDVLWAVPAALACAWLLWRRLPFEAWLLGSALVLALGSGSISLPRIMAANPVFLLAVGDVMDRIRSRTVLVALAVLCAGLQAVFLHRWLLGSRLLM